MINYIKTWLQNRKAHKKYQHKCLVIGDSILQHFSATAQSCLVSQIDGVGMTFEPAPSNIDYTKVPMFIDSVNLNPNYPFHNSESYFDEPTITYDSSKPIVLNEPYPETLELP